MSIALPSRKLILLRRPAITSGLPTWLPLASGVAPTLFADLTTEGTTNHYWYNNAAYGSFAALKAAIVGSTISLAAGTYTNSSGLLASASIGVGRFDYSPALSPNGLLLEGTTRNLCLNSDDPSTWASDGNSGVTVGANTVAPNGTSTARSLTFTSTAFFSTVNGPVADGSNAIEFTAGTVVSGSVWVRSTTGKANIGVALSPLTTTQHRTVPLTSSWQRISFTGASIGADAVAIVLDNRSGVNGGDGIAGTMEAFGAQIEVQPNTTSYIPTLAVRAIRSADTFQVPWTATSFTALAKVINQGVIANARILDADTNGLLYQTAGPNVTTNNGSATVSAGVNAMTSANKIVISGSNSGRVLSANGNTAQTDSNGLVASTPSFIYIGASSDGTNPSFGDFEVIGLWPVTVTAAQAAAMSALP